MSSYHISRHKDQYQTTNVGNDLTKLKGTNRTATYEGRKYIVLQDLSPMQVITRVAIGILLTIATVGLALFCPYVRRLFYAAPE